MWHVYVYLAASTYIPGLPVAQMVKNLPTMWKTRVQYLGREVPLEKGMAMHFGILAQRIPQKEKPRELQSMGLQRVEHDWLSNTHTHTHTHTHPHSHIYAQGLPGGKESTCLIRKLGFNPCVWKIPWIRKLQHTPVSLPGKPHGQWSLVGYSPWCCKDLDNT